jgi:phosphoribosylanthranilate isomerase
MVKIKLCGITNREDFAAAAKLQVDYIGFIFYGGSPRCIEVEIAREIINSVDKIKSRLVGVFVNDRINTIREIYRSLNLDVIQLHGDESAEYCAELSLPYWKAIRVRNEASLKLIERYTCDVVLLDGYSKTAYGGTGSRIPISLLKKALRSDKKIIIAGGISLNMVQPLLQYAPYGLDINSSIEIAPGKKDADEMVRLIEKIRMYDKEYRNANA